MNQVQRYEAIGIIGSIAVMVLALALMRYEPNETPKAVVEEDALAGEVVVATEGEENDQASLANALLEAITTSGDLQSLVIDDIASGRGEEAVVGDSVTVNYIGVTREGLQFDSSYERGVPFTLTLGEGRVIEGWEKGLLGMKVGGQRILIIPPEMAYGDRQVGPIPANSVLIFAVELLNIN